MKSWMSYNDLTWVLVHHVFAFGTTLWAAANAAAAAAAIWFIIATTYAWATASATDVYL